MDLDYTEIDGYKIIKNIGSGYQGKVYLVTKNNEEYALKIFKLYPKYVNKTSQLSRFWREIEFGEYMNKHYPEQFMTLHYSKIIENCTFKPPIIESFLQHQRYLDTLQSKFCGVLVYSLINCTLDKIINKISKPTLYSIIIQCLYSFLILQKTNYIHLDVAKQNIGIINTTKKHTKILNHKIPYFGYKAILIDYGNILNIKHNPNKEELYVYNHNKKYCVDIGYFIFNVLLDIKDTNIDIINVHNLWVLIDKIKELDIYKSLIKYNTNPYNILINFLIMYPILADKLGIVTENIKFYVPKEDISFIGNHIDNIDNIIDYFYKKLLEEIHMDYKSRYIAEKRVNKICEDL